MLSRPTTEQILLGIVRDLDEQVLPHVAHDPARVAIGMIQQLLRGAAQRAAHEQAWMAEEAAAILEVAADPTLAADAGVRDAVSAYEASGGLDRALHLDDAVARYDLASRVLSACVTAAFASADAALVARVGDLVKARSANELQVLGQLDLVGRG